MSAAGIDTLDTGLTIGTLEIVPGLCLAPMAGITHSAFRRLVADFGGYGALWTEMLSGKALAGENLPRSPHTRRSDREGSVFYQLLLDGGEQVEAVVDTVGQLEPAGIDVNLACPAPEVVRRGGGAALFADAGRMRGVVGKVRKRWGGPMTVKCRLGTKGPDWRAAFAERIRMLEDVGIDALIVHPRFFDEKLKRTARREELAWVCSRASVPVVASGDIGSLSTIARCLGAAPGIRAVMVGRMAVVKPWVFAELRGASPVVDYGEVWMRLFDYISRDFESREALRAIKEFNAYYARNFFFGHELFRKVGASRTPHQAREAAEAFFRRPPRVVREPSVMGV